MLSDQCETFELKRIHIRIRLKQQSLTEVWVNTMLYDLLLLILVDFRSWSGYATYYVNTGMTNLGGGRTAALVALKKSYFNAYIFFNVFSKTNIEVRLFQFDINSSPY